MEATYFLKIILNYQRNKINKLPCVFFEAIRYAYLKFLRFSFTNSLDSNEGLWPLRALPGLAKAVLAQTTHQNRSL